MRFVADDEPKIIGRESFLAPDHGLNAADDYGGRFAAKEIRLAEIGAGLGLLHCRLNASPSAAVPAQLRAEFFRVRQEQRSHRQDAPREFRRGSALPRARRADDDGRHQVFRALLEDLLNLNELVWA